VPNQPLQQTPAAILVSRNVTFSARPALLSGGVHVKAPFQG
jgi:hypothetical protein